MQVRYQAALRPEADKYSRLVSALPVGVNMQQGQNCQQVGSQGLDIDRLIAQVKITAVHIGWPQINVDATGLDIAGHTIAPATVLGCLAQSVASATDRESLLIEKITNASDEQHLMMLIVATIAASLHRTQLCELLLPITQHVRLDATQFTDLTDREIAFCRYRRKRFSRI